MTRTTPLSATPTLHRLTLDPRHRATIQTQRDAGYAHQLVMGLLPDDLGLHPRESTKTLFRVEVRDRTITLWLSTLASIELGQAPPGWITGHACRDLAPLLAALRPGRTVRYRVDVNATRVHNVERPGHARPRSTRIPVPPGELESWWTGRLARAGLSPLMRTDTEGNEVPIGAMVTRLPSLGGKASTGDRLVHAATSIDGSGLITNPDTFRLAVTDGIGRGKAYGLGLLTIATLQ